jgi:hypothetical protein
MNIKTLTTYFLVSVILVSPLLANPKFKQAVLKEIIQNTKVTAQEIKNASVAKCFSGSIYQTEVNTKMDQPYACYIYNTFYVMKDEDLIEIAWPKNHEKMSNLQSIVNPEFRLKTKEDGEHLINAMKVLFETAYDEDEVEPHFVQNGSTWSMITGNFFENFEGFIFETNADGKITKISRTLDIKK